MIAIYIAIMIITVYIPGAGNGNGGLTGADWRGGRLLQNGEAACGTRYPFGTVFVMLDDDGLGLGRAFVCRDRGGAIGNRNLDLVLTGGKAEVKRAFAWGRRRREIAVFDGMAEYKRHCHVARRMGYLDPIC